MALPHPNLSEDNVLDVLRLLRTLNVGPVTFFQLIRRFHTAARALERLPDMSVRGGRKNPLTAFPADAAKRELEATAKFGARIILYGEPDYPQLLQFIHDPPPLITVLGHPQLWRRDMVAIVGARNASATGCQLAARLARDLGEAGITVVSGLARGIDSFVHKGALATGTVGVIAGGIDNIYPPENAPLYAELREMGAIISEQPFGSLPFSGSFPGRNRIISGMSLGTLVAEAAPKSGSLITARFAMEQNREVMAVPGSPADPRSKGCNQLIREGAHIIESAGDVLQAIANARRARLEERMAPQYAFGFAEDAADSGELSHKRSLLLEKLGVTAITVDELIEQCEISAPVVMTLLLELELAGRLKRSSGNKVYLTSIMEEMA
jgi:DNA processing protein